MSDINTNISVNIDTSGALAQLKALQRQISTFHTSIAKSSQTASAAQADLQKNFLNAVNGIGAFSAELRTVKTTAENFTSSLEKNKFSMREYFRYAGGATKTFGKLFKSEFDTINKVATENVKNLQTQYIKMGRDANGAMKAIAVRPLTLDMQNLSTQTQIAAQKQALFNQIVKQGSTNLLNFGKNTQWAGRQLMVGFTLPLMALGTTASKTFMDMEAAALKFKKVYGDLFTAPEETQAALDGIEELAKGFTKYGIAVSKTVGLAADAAAAGFQGIDLQRQTSAATKLSVLGQIEQQQALETTISLQNAMGISSDNLASSIDFLNAVENQTVTSLDDITIAIPKVAPVIKSLGGDVKDLAFFMTAMKEGGINASEGANALKSGLASMINPSKKASGMLADMGINIKNIVEKNQGNLRATVVEFALALDKLDPLSRARAIEQMFGKFQFARLSTLFQNVIKDGTQADRVLQLAGSSVEELAALSDKELGMTADSAMNKFRKSVEDLKFALVPVGKVFLEVITPFIEKISGLIEKFNGLSDSTKKVITLITVGLGAIAPVVLMTVGLFANFVANGIKGLMILRNGYLKLTGQSQILGEQTNYLTVEQQQALAAAHSLEQSHARLTQAFTVESTALGQLKNAYIAATTAANNFAMKNPGMMVAPAIPTKRSNGKPAVVGGTGNKDTELALLTPGETVIPKDMSKKYGSLINGMIAGNIPGYRRGLGSEDASFISSIGSIAPQRSQSKITEFLERELQAIPEDLVDEFKSLVITISEEITLSKKELKARLRDFRSQYVSNIGIQERQQFSHIGSAPRISAGNLRESGAITDPKTQERLDYFIEKVGADTLVDPKTGFGANLTGKLNNAMQNAGASLEEVITDSVNIGADKWRKSIEIGGGSFENLADDIVRFDTNFNRNLQSAYDNGARIIVDSQAQIEEMRINAIAKNESFDDTLYVALDTIAEQTRQNINEVGSGLNAVFEEALQTITEVRYYGLSPEQTAALGDKFSGRKNANYGRVTPGATNYGRKYEGVGSFRDIPNSIIAEVANEAGVASPSRKTIPIGEDIGRGLEVGMANRQDDVERSGEALGSAAVRGTRKAASRPAGAPFPVAPANAKMLPIVPADIKSTRVYRGASAPQGPAPIGPATPSTATLLPLIAAPIIAANQAVAKSTENLVDLNNKNKNALGISSGKLASMNKTLNSTTFALTAMAGAGSMFGGKIGELSTQVFKYSGLMFGLMQITQLLTQAQVARLIAERAATAGLLTKTVAEGSEIVTFSRVTGLFAGGIKKFIPNLLRFAGSIGKVLGPWGKLASIAISLGFGFAKLKAFADAQKEKIDGLGNAAFITGERLKTLGDIFGVVPKKFAFEDLPKSVGLGLTSAQRTKTQQVKESENFQKDFGKNIAAIKSATGKEAELLFRGLVIQLKQRGFDKETVEAIINAIKIESGKTDIELDFEKITILTPEGRAAVQKDIVSMLNLAKTTRDIKTASGSLTGIIGSTQSAFEDGSISAQEYSDQMSFINARIAEMPYPKGVELTNAIFASMDQTGVLAKTASGIKNINDRLLVMNAIALAGLSPDSPLIKGLKDTDLLMQDISRRGITNLIGTNIKQLIDGISKVQKTTEDLNGGITPGTGDLSSASKKAIDALNKEIKVLEKKKKALADVNNEISRQQEFQIKQQQIDADMVQAKISGNYIQAALLGQQKLYNQSQYNRETAELDLERQIQALQDRIDAIESGDKVSNLGKKITKLESKKKDTTPKTEVSTPTIVPKYSAEPKRKDIPSFLPSLNSLIKKTGGMLGTETVAFDPTTGSWKEVKIGSIPKNYITKEQWLRGTKTYATGGSVRHFGPGGNVSGPGTGTSDSIPAMLSDGEYVIQASSVAKYGTHTFDSLNAGKFAEGGTVNSNAPHNMGIRSMGSAQEKKPSIWSKIVHKAIKSIDPFKVGKHRLGYDFFGGKEIANILSGTGRKMDYLSAALTPIGIGKIGKVASAVKPDGLELGQALFGNESGVNTTYRAIYNGVDGFYKKLDKDEAVREVFGSLFLKKAGLIAPNNTFIKDAEGYGVFSENILTGGSNIENAIARQLSSRPPELISKFESLSPRAIEKHTLDLAKELGNRNAILSGFNYTDKHGGNLITNLLTGKMGALDFGISLNKTKRGSTGPSAVEDLIRNLVSPTKSFKDQENIDKYMLGILEGAKTLATYKKEEILKMLDMSGMAESSAKRSSLLDFVLTQIENTKEAAQQITQKKANGGLVNYKLPSYSLGSSYIPEDQIAQLHKGERVLTAEENKIFSASGSITNIININGSDLNKKEIAQAVMVELDKVQKKNNKTNTVKI